MHRSSVESLPAIVVTPAAADAVRGIGQLETLPATDRAALVDIGILGEDDQLTPAGRRLRDDIRDAPVVLLFSREVDVPVQRARLYVGRRHMMYLAVHAPEEVRQTSELLVFPADAVPIVLARWGGLQPTAQTPHASHGPIPREQLWRRCADATEPLPEGADDALAEVWRRPWRVWGAQCDLREISLAYVDVEGLGTFVIRTAGEEAVQLVARPSSLLWGDLQGVLRPLGSRPTDEW